MPALLRRIGYLTIGAALAAPALPALAASGSSGHEATAPTVASVFAKGHDPDMVGAGVDPTAYLRARDAYFNARAGNPFVGGHGNLRVAGINAMHRQQKQQLAAAAQAQSTDAGPAVTSSGASPTSSSPGDLTAPVATASWSPLGPSPLPNGQTQTVSTPVSGRATSIAIDPSNKNIVYVGSAGGGVFRTMDGGATWTAIADGMQVLAVGALAVAPTDSSVLYVGTGETNLGLDSYAGVGLYRIDGANGATPTLVGPINPAVSPAYDDGHAFTAQGISRILVSPTNAGSVLVSTTYGNVGKYGTSRATSSTTTSIRGIWRSTNANGPLANITFTNINGGSSALGIDAGVTDMAFDPTDSTTVVAGVTGSSNGSAVQGVWRGTSVWATPTWTHPLSPPAGTNSVWRFASSAATSTGGATRTFYAANDEANGVVRMSTDGGATWSAALPAFNGHCGGQCWYDDPLGVSPSDPGIVLAGGDGGSPLRKSADYGQTQIGTVDTGLHADAHAIAFAPTDSSTVWIGNDGGVFKSTDAGSTWTSENTAGLDDLQFQSLAVHPTDASFSVGGTQDNGTEWRHTDGSWIRADWGDGGASAIDQSTTSTSAVTIYHTYYNIQGSQIGFARITNTAYAQEGYWSQFGCGFSNNGIGCADATEFYAPLTLGPGTPNTLYFGSDRLYRSTDQGTTMTLASQAPLMSGAKVTAIGISPTTDNSRVVGLSNGHVWATTTGSSTLTDVTGGWPLVAGQAVVVDDVKVDPADPATAFVGLGNYFGSSASHLWKTTTLGSTNTFVAATGLPDVPVNAIAIDPSNHKYVYVGTDIGVYYSTNGGTSFAPFGSHLPAVAVFDLKVVQPGTAGGTLRIATHGRGLWQIPIGDAAAPSTVTLSPTSASVAAGDPQSFVATAHYDDGSTADITSQATWTSSSPAVATVSGGAATTKTAGSTTITATFHSVAGNASLTVTPAVLRSLAVAPSTLSVAKGAAAKLTATGTYSDASTRDLSDTATWTTDTAAVAGVDTHGLVSGVSPGAASVSASMGGYLASSAVTVTPAVVTSIAVSPGAKTVAAGDPATFTATATWSDTNVTDVTSTATWSSSNTAVATVATGTATTKTSGSSTITATVNGKSGTSALTVTAPVLRSVAVTPPTVQVAKGLQTQLAATGTYSDGSTQSVTSTAIWQSGTTSIATVDSLGLVTGVAQGTATVTATVGSTSGHSAVAVGPAVVTSISVTPVFPTVAKGDTKQFAATATWSDGTTSNATNLATWTSGTPSVAAVDANGLASTVGQGAASISATYGGASDATTLTVTAPALQSITVSPHTASVAKGDTQTFSVTGHYSDGSTGPVTTGITWSSSAPSAAMVTSSGVATGTGIGNSTITATVGTNSDGATLTVTQPALRSISVSPGAPSIAKGNNVPLTVMGAYSDGSSQDVTGSASWSSADTGIATVDTTGLVHGAGQGQAAVTATVGSYTAYSTVTVGPAVVSSLAVSASPTSVAAGDPSQMTATASMSDGTAQDVTAAATWSSDNTPVATVATDGLVSSHATGTANITATYQSMSHSAGLSVTPAVLVSIAVTPVNPSVASGLTAQLNANGTYSDGSHRDVTDSVTWTSAHPSVATVDALGLVTALGQGTSDVTAAVDGVSSGTTVTVTAPVVISVDVNPPTPSVPLGDTQAFTATANWSDGSTTDVTSSATWSSTDTSVATMSGAVAHSAGTGTTTITASAAGKGGMTTLTITAAVLRSIAVTPAPTKVPPGLTTQLTATGTYSDGSTQDLTPTAAWQSDNTSAATVDRWGLVTGVQEGTGTITATVGSVSSEAGVTVTPAVVTALTVSPLSPTVVAGDTEQFTATATWSAGAPTDVTAAATWTSGDTTVATVDSQGLATGVKQGTAGISAAYGGKGDATTLSVAPAVLQSVTVTPGAMSVPAGDSTTFAVTGHYSDGSSSPVTSGVTWSAADAAVASVTPGGVATGGSVGSTTVTATVDSFADSATLTVTPAVLQSMTVTPQDPSIPVGLTRQLTATGTYSDGSHLDVTDSATWTSADTSVASVDTHGLAGGQSEGSSNVTAAFGGVSSATTVSVTAAVVTTVEVTPGSTSVVKGDPASFTAAATWSDGHTADVTSSAAWSSSDISVATMTDAVASSVGVGTTTISATLSDGNVGTATLIVAPEALRSIAVTPTTTSVAKGLTTQLTATGTYSDGSTQDLTHSVAWQSDTSAATVDAWGLVTGVQEGAATITATVGSLSSQVGINVTPAVLTALTISPVTPSVAAGDTRQFAAIATWSDTTTRDVTAQAVWSSDATGVATIGASTGLASSLKQGTAGISAAYLGATDATTLTVTAPVLRALAVTPATAKVMAGKTKQYVATGTFSDGSKKTVSSSVRWSTGNLKVAKVGATGVLTGVAYGTTWVTAVSGAIASNTASISVTHKAPTVTGFSPGKGKIGTIVTVTGTNFVTKPGMVVKFGGTKATWLSIVSGTKLRVRVPKGARSGYIYVTNDGGTARSKVTFHVV